MGVGHHRMHLTLLQPAPDSGMNGAAKTPRATLPGQLQFAAHQHPAGNPVRSLQKIRIALRVRDQPGNAAVRIVLINGQVLIKSLEY